MQQRNFPFLPRQAGFTLLEMIVVLVIIGLIMGLVGPRLFGQADKAKVQTAMLALPDGSLEDWVSLAYDDVPPRMWPIAKRSLIAHVERIRSLAGLTP